MGSWLKGLYLSREGGRKYHRGSLKRYSSGRSQRLVLRVKAVGLSLTISHVVAHVYLERSDFLLVFNKSINNNVNICYGKVPSVIRVSKVFLPIFATLGGMKKFMDAISFDANICKCVFLCLFMHLVHADGFSIVSNGLVVAIRLNDCKPIHEVSHVDSLGFSGNTEEGGCE